AEKAGLKPGDVVVAVDGQTMTFAPQLIDAISKHPGQPVTLSILRNGTSQTISATPCVSLDRVRCDTLAPGEVAKRSQGFIGIGISDETKSVKPGAFEAIGLSVRKNVEYSALIFQTV